MPVGEEQQAWHFCSRRARMPAGEDQWRERRNGGAKAMLAEPRRRGRERRGSSRGPRMRWDMPRGVREGGAGGAGLGWRAGRALFFFPCGRDGIQIVILEK